MTILGVLVKIDAARLLVCLRLDADKAERWSGHL